MATQDTSKDDEVLEDSEEVETLEEDDSSLDTESESDEETEDSDENEDSDEDADAETEEEDEVEFKKRFTQFKGDSYEEYTPKLEEAYGNSLREMTRLKQSNKETQSELDAIRAAIAKDPDLAQKLKDVTGDDNVAVDPALLKARQDMEESMTKEFNEFVEAHPELESDPQLAEEVLAEVEELGKLARKKGKILSMAQALKKAWIIVGRDDTEEIVASKAKEVAAKPKTSGSAKKTAKKPVLSAEELKWAKKFGVTPDQAAAAKSS